MCTKKKKKNGFGRERVKLSHSLLSSSAALCLFYFILMLCIIRMVVTISYTLPCFPVTYRSALCCSAAPSISVVLCPVVKTRPISSQIFLLPIAVWILFSIFLTVTSESEAGGYEELYIFINSTLFINRHLCI